MVPCVDNTAPHMLAFWRRFFDAGCLSNIDRKLALGPRIGEISTLEPRKP